MDTQAAWFLNLDAELELAAPTGYTPNQRVLMHLDQQKAKLTRLTGNDLVLGNGPVQKNIARGLSGRAWCPTPYALKQLERSGATVPSAPPLAVLQQANHRKFCAELGQTLDGAELFTDAPALLKHVERYASTRWVLKRGFGFAGRGQRTTRPRLDADDRRWIVESFAYGAVQVEPCVEIVQEFALHGVIPERGEPVFGVPTVQEGDEQRSWAGSRLSGPLELDPEQLMELKQAANLSARALQDAGYFGPFGIDSYVYRATCGALRLNPRSEINARYTMGYALGMHGALGLDSLKRS